MPSLAQRRVLLERLLEWAARERDARLPKPGDHCLAGVGGGTSP